MPIGYVITEEIPVDLLERIREQRIAADAEPEPDAEEDEMENE
jgi:hypothetical protein